jgi:hypothetical protein
LVKDNNMRRIIPTVLLLAACEPFATGGAGQTVDGQPVSGTYMFDPADRMITVQIISPAGWTCQSRFARTGDRTIVTRSVPLACNDGKTGTIVLTLNQFQDQVVGAFQLSDDTAGQVTFGQT